MSPLTFPPEVRSPIASEPVIFGSDRPNGGNSKQRSVRHGSSLRSRHRWMWLLAPSLRDDHDLRSRPKWLRTKCAVNSRPQNSRIALTSRLQIGVDCCLVSRALQLPERGCAGQIERRVKPGRFRERGSGSIEATFPAQRHSPQCGGACTPLVRGQRRRDIDIGPERRPLLSYRGCGALAADSRDYERCLRRSRNIALDRIL